MADDLFEHASREATEAEAPLAARMRPRRLEELVGQRHLFGARVVTARVARARRHLVGDPLGAAGIGQDHPGTAFGLGHLPALRSAQRGHLGRARPSRRGRRSPRAAGLCTSAARSCFIDEIPPLQQGATRCSAAPCGRRARSSCGARRRRIPTPASSRPLLSRVRVLRLEPLSRDDLRVIVQRAIDDAGRGLAESGPQLSMQRRSTPSSPAPRGDARTALNWTEAAALHATGRRR